jgi:F0F1-type ATP synthase assembly protein I
LEAFGFCGTKILQKFAIYTQNQRYYIWRFFLTQPCTNGEIVCNLAAYKKRIDMKFIGFLIFLLIFAMGFSMLIFLALFVGYWITLVQLEKVAPNLAYKLIGHKPEDNE